MSWLCSSNTEETSGRADHVAGYPLRELMRTEDLCMIHRVVEARLGFAFTTTTGVGPDFDVVLHPTVQDLGERRVSFIRRSGYGAEVVRGPAVIGTLGGVVEAGREQDLHRRSQLRAVVVHLRIVEARGRVGTDPEHRGLQIGASERVEVEVVRP